MDGDGQQCYDDAVAGTSVARGSIVAWTAMDSDAVQSAVPD